MSRASTISFLRNQPDVSVLIIGAGINGIGTFRDLALQGVDVLMVDKGDYGSGASAASSHMLHGGIRYLENGEFRLVREALTERNLMLKNAPHYAKPLPTTIPIFSWFSGLFNAPLKFFRLREKPSERGALVIKIGLILYDIFARNYRVMPTHALHMKQKALTLFPHFNRDIVCAASYYDAWMPYPERICLELVLDTLKSAPETAHAANYISAVGTDDVGDVLLRDELTGEQFIVKPQIVINAAGPWIDFANDAVGATTRLIGGTKGSHIILDHPELYEATGGHEIFFENSDGRIVLILPFLGKVMVGTTDIRIDNPDEAVCTPEEIDYMLGLVSKVFPKINVQAEQIIFNFCGVRPLPSSDSAYTGNVSRDHSIHALESTQSRLKFPVLSLVGGKWTTFRAFAEQAADQVLARLNKSRVASTMNLAIGGGRDYPQDAAQWIAEVSRKSALSEARVTTLFERYGTRAEAIAAFMAGGDDAPLRTLPVYSQREIVFLVQNEEVTHLDDLVLRRTLIAWMGLLNTAALAELAQITADALGWSAEQQAAEIARATHILATRHGVNLTGA